MQNPKCKNCGLLRSTIESFNKGNGFNPQTYPGPCVHDFGTEDGDLEVLPSD